MESKKILVFSLPAMGHTNPLFTMINWLHKTNEHLKIFVYSNKSFKKRIEDNKCIFCDMGEFSSEQFQNDLDSGNGKIKMFSTMIEMNQKLIDENILRITNEIANEKPDLILYDNVAVYAKWVLRLLRKRYDEMKYTPKIISYHTTFYLERGIFPNNEEEKMLMNLGFVDKIQMFFNVLKLNFKGKHIASKYGIEYMDPLQDSFQTDTSICNVVFTFPELQPKSELFSKNIKFVGSCITDSTTLDDVKDDNLKKILEMFPPRNPYDRKQIDASELNDKILLYVSLGSLLNYNLPFYLKLFEVFDQIQKLYGDKKTIYAIVSVGAKCFEEFNKNNQQVPLNMQIVAYAPQIEILKRASLFVTHCGMNSTSEAIHFGVPTICFPVGADQPLVAHRLVNELQLGVQLDLKTFTVNDLKSAILKIVNDEELQQKNYEFAQLSRRYIGQQRACDIVLEHLN